MTTNCAVAVPAYERFSRHVDTSGECHVWTGALNSKGYGLFWYVDGDRRCSKAHRFSWEHEHGRISAGLVIDHLCRNRACVRVDHLELVTPRENILRGVRGALKTHCAQDRKSTRLNSSHVSESRMPSSA